MRWDLDRVAALCGGEATGAAEVTSVVVHSGEATSGSLFVAMRGEVTDGHAYIDDAVTHGASAVVCERGRLPEGVVGVEVDDPLEALRALGAGRRSEISVPVVAITGSSGKTTTKDLVAAVLGPGTHAALRSFNNEVGVPLTVLATPDDATAVVVEVGSRGAGHIAGLADVVAPDVSVITNIGRAHLETFGSVEGVLEAKWELVEALRPDGVAVLPAGDRRLTARRDGAMVTFGEEDTADVVAADVVLDDAGCARFELRFGSEVATVRMGIPGRHQPSNAAAAVAAAVALGRPFAAAASRLDDAAISPWRMESLRIPIGDGSVTIVNDAYNANPDSVTAALETVAAMPGRRVAVLGKMHELGESEQAAHREMGALASSLGFEVIVVGEDPGIASGAGPDARIVSTPDAAVVVLRQIMEPGDVVLVKASRAAGLEAVVHSLQEVHA